LRKSEDLNSILLLNKFVVMNLSDIKKAVSSIFLGLVLTGCLLGQDAQDYPNWDANKSSQIRQIERGESLGATGVGDTFLHTKVQFAKNITKAN
jgi:hypothetical protein